MSNMYNWIDTTINPLGGKCQHQCAECQAKYYGQGWEEGYNDGGENGYAQGYKEGYIARRDKEKIAVNFGIKGGVEEK